MRGQVKHITMLLAPLLLFISCSNKSSPPPPPPTVKPTAVKNILLNATAFNNTAYDVTIQPSIRVEFTEPLKPSSIAGAVKLTNAGGTEIGITTTLQNNDLVLLVQPSSALTYLSKYNFTISTGLRSSTDGSFSPELNRTFITKIDSTRKFPVISDNALLDLVQQQTFKYFWDYAHPVSGLARERSNATPETVTSGGSGFGIMAIVTGINRGFITRTQGLARMQTIVSFLKNTAQKFHGAFPHWLNGSTGVVIPFSQFDNGADLVETSYLMMGLLTARQFFNGVDAAETVLRNDINILWNGVEWNWFRQNNQNVLYWHWSPNYNWQINLPIRGWNECLITYELAASSTTFSIPPVVYSSGWTANGSNGFTNGNTYYTYTLPLGPPFWRTTFLFTLFFSWHQS